MIADYMKFDDEDQMLGLWYVGALEKHLYCAVKVDMKYKTVQFDVFVEADSKNATAREALDLAIVVLKTLPWPLMTFTDPDKPDFQEAHARVHDILFPLASAFINPGGPGGMIKLGPGTGKELREKAANQPWDKLLGTEDAAKKAN